MKSIRGVPPEFVTVGNDNLNLFVARFGKIDVILRQPRRKDIGRQKLAMRDMSENTLKRYRRRNVDKNIYDIHYRSTLPLYRGGVPGFLPMIMEVDSTIVAFVDAFLKTGAEFPRFEIKPEERAISCSIGVLDKYQGLGYGTAYSYLTDEIGRTFGCDWILGVAHLRKGTYNIRIRDGWETVRKYGEYADHKKRLSQ